MANEKLIVWGDGDTHHIFRCTGEGDEHLIPEEFIAFIAEGSTSQIALETVKTMARDRDIKKIVGLIDE